jgi:hypothetical protein
MAFAVGVSLALAVGLFATVVGLDRDRAFYPTVMIVIAALYSLFAVMGGSTHALVLEALIGVVFIVGAVGGFKWSLWIVAGALAAHGIYDFVHDWVVANPGVPSFWPAFCGAYDVTAAAYLAWLLASGRAHAATHSVRLQADNVP